MPEYIKMSSLVGEDITVQSVPSFSWKMWDKANNKMLVSDSWQKDYRKLWQVITDKGQLDVSQSQMGSMLEAMCHAGKSDINGATFSIKSNNKTGMEIRYFINPVKSAPKDEVAEYEPRSDW